MTTPFLLSSQVVESEWSKIHINNKKAESTIVLDTIAPSINLISPHIKEGDVFKTDQEKFTLIGKTFDNVGGLTLLINSKNVIPSSSGLFKQEVSLKKGINAVSIIAIDLEENISEKTVNIEYSPNFVYTENIDVK